MKLFHFLFKISILEYQTAAVLCMSYILYAEVYILSCPIGSKGNILFKGDLSRMYQATVLSDGSNISHIS